MHKASKRDMHKEDCCGWQVDVAWEKMYRALLLARYFEEEMLLLLRKGQLSKWFSGIGQEAISVGSTLAMDEEEYILPLHRNVGVFTTRGVPIVQMLNQIRGMAGGFTKGRDRSFHFTSVQHRIVGMISHLGAQLPVADGLALASVLREDKKAVLVFCGDGSTSQGDFHEALNVAAVWDLPVIFLVENNGYALSTPTKEQYRCKSLVERAVGYGMQGVQIDGNDCLAVYIAMRRLLVEIRRRPRPVMVECITFRMRGHEEASGVKYVPSELIDDWVKKDPIVVFEGELRRLKVCSPEELVVIRDDVRQEVKQGVESAGNAASIVVDSERELEDVYAAGKKDRHELETTSPSRLVAMRFCDSITDALGCAMRKFPELVIMGQDIAEYGGVFKITEGLLEEFGAKRVRNTPLCESAIIGASLGLSLGGFKSVVEMQFADFVSCGFNQIVNNLAKCHYRTGAVADVVIRMPTGAGTRAGPFHSQSTEAWFFNTPGLKIVYPSTPFDAKGLLLAAIEDPNPIMFFEHKLLYRTLKEDIPEDYYSVEIGRARIVQEGEDVAIITYGQGVHWARKLADSDGKHSIYILDLRSLKPLDYEAIERAVKATGRVLILHEASLMGGIGAEIAAYISEHLFSYLDAPVVRCASLDTPVPFAAALEDDFLAVSRLMAAFKKVLLY